jgi:hypothetical protein
MDVPVAANVLGTLGAVCLTSFQSTYQSLSDLVMYRFVGLSRYADYF